MATVNMAFISYNLSDVSNALNTDTDNRSNLIGFQLGANASSDLLLTTMTNLTQASNESRAAALIDLNVLSKLVSIGR